MDFQTAECYFPIHLNLVLFILDKLGLIPTMRVFSGLAVIVAACFSPAAAVYQGFNYGSTFTTGAAKLQSDFES